MGIGTYYIDPEDGACVYMDREDTFGTYEPECWDFDLLLHDLASFLPNSYQTEWTRAGEFHEHGAVIAENELFIVSLREWETDLVLCLYVDPKLEGTHTMNLARANVQRAAQGIFKSLHKCGFKLRVRTSAWTSAPYQPKESQ